MGIYERQKGAYLFFNFFLIRKSALFTDFSLIDSRFARPDYRALFPAHWSGMRYVSSADEVRALIRDFWAGEPPVA